MKKIICLLVCILFLLVGCRAKTNQLSSDVNSATNIRYVHNEYFDTEVINELGDGSCIIRDKNTNVLYLVICGYKSAVITPIYNSDGTVKLYDNNDNGSLRDRIKNT